MTRVRPGEILVFASNLYGHHREGPDIDLATKMGAHWGNSFGLGRLKKTFALPCYHGCKHRLTQRQARIRFGRFRLLLKRLFAYAEANPQLKFIIGDSLGKHAPWGIKHLRHLFRHRPANVRIPRHLMCDRRTLAIEERAARKAAGLPPRTKGWRKREAKAAA